MYSDLENAAADFFAVAQTDARRVFHGRGHLYPGLEHLTVDWYPPVVLITTYEEIEKPELLGKHFVQHDNMSQVKSVLLQYRKRKGAPSICLYGETINHCIVEESGVKFEIQPGVNQNAGLFLDMAPLRGWLRENSRDRNLLNLFAYTCSLSVAALAGNAKQVVNVDMSKTSIKWGERNHQLNGQESRKVRSIPHNLFRSWGRIKQFGRYDIVIVDPPSRQRGSFDAEKNYGAVLKKMHQLVNPGASVIATINSPYLNEDYLPNLVARYASGLTFKERMPVAPEFADRFPERGLKIYHFTT